MLRARSQHFNFSNKLAAGSSLTLPPFSEEAEVRECSRCASIHSSGASSGCACGGKFGSKFFF
jgi:hypothetical protein